MKTNADKIEEILEAVDNDEYEPTDWEDDFLDTMEEKVREYQTESLSDKQQNSLDELWEKATKGKTA